MITCSTWIDCEGQNLVDGLVKNDDPIEYHLLRQMRKFKNVRVFELRSPFLLFPRLVVPYAMRGFADQNVRVFTNVEEDKMPNANETNEILNAVIRGTARTQVDIRRTIDTVDFAKPEAEALGYLLWSFPGLRRIRFVQGTDRVFRFGGRSTSWRMRPDRSWGGQINGEDDADNDD